MEILGLRESVQDALGGESGLKVTDECIQKVRKIIEEGTKSAEEATNLITTLNQFPPHIFLNVLLSLDSHLFDNFSSTQVLDIPVQAKQAADAKVPSQFLATIGVLKNQGQVVVNDKIIQSIQSLGQKESGELTKSMDYQPGVGTPKFIESVTKLIAFEEQKYGWRTPQGFVTKPVFIPGGTPGIAFVAHKFMSQGDIALVPNTRWPNVDTIFQEATKVPPITVDLIGKDGTISFTHLETLLTHFQQQKREEVTVYLNFPNNPTGVRFSKEQGSELSELLKRFPNFKTIRVVIDDPYGAFSLENDKTLYTPLSYMIDARDSNIEIFELGAHGTKEAGVYGGRIAVLRAIVGTQDKQAQIEKRIAAQIRSFLSMSPSIPQEVYASAIANPEAYIQEREKMIDVVFPNIHTFRKTISETCGKYLIPIENSGNTGGFFLAFRAKSPLIDLEKVRQKCLSYGEEGIGFIVLPDYTDGSQVMRITLIPGEYEEFANRLKRGIEESII